MTSKKEDQRTDVGINGNIDGNVIVGNGNKITVSNKAKNPNKTSVETHVNVYLGLESKQVGKQVVEKIKDPQKRKGDLLLNLIKDNVLFLGGIGFILSGVLLVFNVIVITAIIKAGLSGAAGSDFGKTSPESLQPQLSSAVSELTLTSGVCDATIEILNNAGEVILAITILPGTTQTFKLPTGDYTYNVKYDCPDGLAGAAGISLPQDYSQSFYQSADGDIRITSPKRDPFIFTFALPFSLNQFIGGILIIFGILFVLLNIYKKSIKRDDEFESISL